MSEKSIDLAVFTDLRATTGAEFVADLVDTFIEETPGILAELRTARAVSDAERFRRAAHSLKSNANAFGATRLAALARDLERKGLDADQARDESALAALDGAYLSTAEALKVLCNG
jgi:histidine phosphotransfer protein HptB